jgi:hypothetical protein
MQKQPKQQHTADSGTVKIKGNHKTPEKLNQQKSF